MNNTSSGQPSFNPDMPYTYLECKAKGQSESGYISAPLHNFTDIQTYAA
jgi:hypothetical protein